VGVEKVLQQKNGRRNFALGSPTNDFLNFPRHFLSPKFSLFREKGTFSTATPDFNSYPWTANDKQDLDGSQRFRDRTPLKVPLTKQHSRSSFLSRRFPRK
jgi:hypothetical protein